MRGKRYTEAKKMIDSKKSYTVAEAVQLVKDASRVKFDATVELHVKLGIDVKQSDQNIRGTISLPHSVGKSRRVAAFVEPDKEAEAKAAGADLIGSEELINEIVTKGKIDFDVAVATPGMMPKLAKAAKVLGPKGLMPNPKTDTVGAQIGKIIAEQKAGKLTFKNDDTGNVHVMVGKVSFDNAKITENLNAILDLMRKLKPSTAKGIYFKTVVLTSTMGPAVHLQVS
ncbi:MAG: 50S ribosomal protein L1 [Patescibacteria group bacterium]